MAATSRLWHIAVRGVGNGPPQCRAAWETCFRDPLRATPFRISLPYQDSANVPSPQPLSSRGRGPESTALSVPSLPPAIAGVEGTISGNLRAGAPRRRMGNVSRWPDRWMNEATSTLRALSLRPSIPACTQPCRVEQSLSGSVFRRSGTSTRRLSKREQGSGAPRDQAGEHRVAFRREQLVLRVHQPPHRRRARVHQALHGHIRNECARPQHVHQPQCLEGA